MKKNAKLIIIIVLLIILCAVAVFLLVGKPDRVTGTEISVSGYNSLAISWRVSENTNAYQVMRAESKNGEYEEIAEVEKTQYTDKNLESGKEYFYKIRGVNIFRKGSCCTVISAIPGLDAVGGLEAEAASSTSVKLEWDTVEFAEGYQLWISTSEDGEYTKEASIKDHEYSDKGLTSNKTYYYKVRAYVKEGEEYVYGEYSEVASCKLKDASASLRDSMLAQINAERAAAGVGPVTLYSAINSTAQAKAEDMAKKGYFNHNSPSLGHFYDQYKAAGIKFTAGAENIARGQKTVTEVMNDWMNSSGHRKNILNSKYKYVGIGYYNGYWVQQFMK